MDGERFLCVLNTELMFKVNAELMATKYTVLCACR